MSRANTGVLEIIPTIIGTCSVAVLRLLTARHLAPGADTADNGPDRGRRLWLVALGLVGLGVVGGVTRRSIGTAVAQSPAIAKPYPTAGTRTGAPAAPLHEVKPKGVALRSYITSNDDFYRIDTALTVPQLSRANWRLKIHGMVDGEVTRSFEDLKAFPIVEKFVTLTRVSNPVGGDLISNARWTGYRMRDLLAGTGIHADVDASIRRVVVFVD